MNAIEYVKKNGIKKSKIHLDRMKQERWINSFFNDLKKIVDGAPSWAKCWNTRMGCYIKGNIKYSSNIDLDSLRSQLAKREPIDLRAVDIPHGTIVLEK